MNSKKFSSLSNTQSDLTRQVRQATAIRERLKLAETSAKKHGWVTRTPNEMLDRFKENARRDGEL